MASTSELYRKRQGTSLTTCPPPEPNCSTCGMLECTCRPRFFAGQVLNADDLNRLDAYIRAKNRLHNRQLHGWGVVNGLEVMCNPCGDGVAVGCGYALGPCGDDIVVCDAVTVDVCSLIRRCKDAEAKCGPCAPFQHPGVAGCDAAEEEWILAIRYSEKAQRGVKPLYATAQADCGCSCGKASCSCGAGGGSMKSGSCGCGAKSVAQCTCSTTAKPRGAPVQCEATVICEGFEFEVYRREPPPKPKDDNGGTIKPTSPLIARFRCCYDDLITKAPQIPGTFTAAAVAANPNAWYLWACRFQAHLLRHYQSASGYNCALLAQLGALVVTQPGPNGAGLPALIQGIQLLLLVALDGLFACLCSALLPPCPPATVETRVPLASLHVANNPCRVIRVCNWAVERKFATTFPALQYWLSVLPYGASLRTLLQTLCCFDVTGLFSNKGLVGVAANVDGVPRDVNLAAGAGAGVDGNTDFFHQQAMLRLNPTLTDPVPLKDASTLLADVLISARPLEPELLMNTLFVGNAQADKLPAAEGANMAQFLLLNQLAKPMAQAAFGALGKLDTGPATGGFGGPAFPASPASTAPAAQPAPRETPAAAPDADTLAAMRAEMAKLQATVERHASELEHLRAKPAGSRPKKGNR